MTSGSYKRTPEHCAALSKASKNSDAVKAHNKRMRGTRRTPETCAKISKATKGKPASEAKKLTLIENRKKAKIARESDIPLPDGYEIDKNSKIYTNKECGSYLGIFITEQILAKIFKNVKKMPQGHVGYDFICGQGYMVDSKSAATGDKRGFWLFNIEWNKIADYFILVAFNNRKDLKIEHIWLIPGKDVNDHKSIQISKVTIARWSKYEQPIDKAILCCNKMKEHQP